MVGRTHAPGEVDDRGTGGWISPVLQGLETTAATGEIKQGYRAHGLLGAPGNPESLSSDPVQIPLLSDGPDSPRSGKGQRVVKQTWGQLELDSCLMISTTSGK